MYGAARLADLIEVIYGTSSAEDRLSILTAFDEKVMSFLQ